MKIKGAVLTILLVAAATAGVVPLAADDGKPTQQSIIPVHMVLDEDLPTTLLEPDADKVGAQIGTGPELEAAWETVKFEDFEGAFPNQWDLRGDPTWDDEYDMDPFFAYDLSQWTGWCAGGGAHARTPGSLPGGAYANNMNAWMIYGPFSLRGYLDAVVEFWYWLWSEQGPDYVAWMASVNGRDFYGNGDSGNNKNWRSHTFDLKNVNVLGNLLGRQQVWIAFAFHSDSGLAYKGAYLDDIHIKRKPSAKPRTGMVKPTHGNRPAGQWQAFTTSYWDADGWANLKQGLFHIGATVAKAGNVRLLYHVKANRVRILNNATTAWKGWVAPGSNVILQNNRMKLDVKRTRIWRSGNLLQVRWRVLFKHTFRGRKRTFLRADDLTGLTSGWQRKGQWRIY
jgi:hypothetical protein